jgi:hypothetical protein
MAKKKKPKKPKFELESAPWIDDPDEPDRMTDEQIKHMAKGAAELYRSSKPEK